MCKVMLGLSAAVLTVGVLAGCSSAPVTPAASEDPQQAGLANQSSVPYTFYVKLPNGRQVLCAGVNGYDGGGGLAPTTLSCDWSNAQGLNKGGVD